MITVYIITPLYNGVEFLEETVRSVIAQDYQHWQMTIGVNGHGEDGGAVAIEAQRISGLDGSGRIEVIIQPPPINSKSKSLNDLIARLPAEAEWVCLLDADDTWTPHKLSRQVIAANTGCVDVIGTWCRYFGEASGVPRLPSGMLPRGSTLRFNPIINSSSMFRKGDAYWEETAHIQGVEDYDMWLRLDHAGRRLYNIPEVLTNHRLHRASAFNGKGGQDPQSLVLKYSALQW